jgi:hypothetical protein
MLNVKHAKELIAPVTWHAIIRLTNGNQQRVTILADNQINARLMIEAQYGRGSIVSGPHRLDLMSYLRLRHLGIEQASR